MSDALKQYADRVGLDVARWAKDMGAPEIKQQIDRETAGGACRRHARGADGHGRRAAPERAVEGFKQLSGQAKKQG